MKILTGSRGDEVHEHLYENGQRRVGHRILKKNTVTNNGEFHPVPGNIVLIPLKGTVKLTIFVKVFMDLITATTS